ncbi:degenerin del-1-like isoform X2 [Haliotis rufescens]|uniref:degenerin del-1-like isoform X2 n=1 Tax=Haliotis rufescens TaxID=6454 RepID=UPI00201EEBFE|nr:degenerin del-1-like isoform X2 [Haliotis rufescens]
MSVKRSNSKQLRDYPGYSGNFTHVFDHDDAMDKPYNRNWEPPADYQESMDPSGKWGRDITFHQKYSPPSNVGSDQYDSEGNPKTFKRVLTRFAGRTSMQGIPYIHTSKTWYAKLVWVVLLLGALCVMGIHLYTLSSSYIMFEKQTKVQLGFQNLKFPSITFCNVNPVRSSMISKGRKELKDYIRTIRADAVASSLKNKRQQNNLNQGPNQQQSPGPRPQPAPGRRKRFIDSFEYNFTNTRRQEPPGFNFFSGQTSTLQDIRKEFTHLFSSEERATRIEMGHSISDMLVSCAFSGVVCNESFFRIHPTSMYGNCYTLENSAFVSFRSGPSNGLELILFLETDEHISTIASGIGTQFQIHGENTWPDPEVDGMSVSATMETSIGMRMLEIHRMSDPYGKCDDGAVFKAKYGKQYTRKTCETFCVHERIINRCGCFDELKETLYRNINSSEPGRDVPPCRTKTQMVCLQEIESRWETGLFQCNCFNPCQERLYEKNTHSRTWPSDAYANLLVQYLCNNKNETECERFEKMSYRDLSRNFMKVNIFFDDLNYENITEIPSYEDVQFYSDIGGTVGLWVGLSVLSLAEVAQFLWEIIQYLLCWRRRKTQKTEEIDDRSNWDARMQMRVPQPINRLSGRDRDNGLY